MANIVLTGDTSGAITVAAPAVAGTNTLTLPAATGTLATTATSGKILQVKSVQKTTAMTTTSTSYSTIETVSITPSATTSKIMIFWNTNAGTNGNVGHGYLALFRDTTEIGSADTAGSRTSAQAVFNTEDRQQMGYSGSYLDSPSSTSEIDYTLQVKGSNTNTFAINRSARDTDNASYDGRSTTTITAIEIGV
tara:strand:+ start:432 stop:1010 length:579 start_codon:yes stop_codon:yes gene_type:complete